VWSHGRWTNGGGGGPGRGWDRPGTRVQYVQKVHVNASRLKRPVALGAILVATALLASACSGTSNKQAGQTTTSPTSRTSTTVRQSTTTSPTTDRSRAWSAPKNVSARVVLGAVSCSSTRSCVTLGANGQAYHYSRGTWSNAVATGASVGTIGIPTLSCAGPSFCMAVWRGTTEAVVWNGGSWSAPMPVGGSQALQGVGCASPTFCVAVDGIGAAFYYNGSGWSEGSQDWGSVQSISCPSSTFCFSVAGGVSMWNGTSWTEPVVYGTTSVITSVSCPTATFCVAVDTTGEAIQWNGSKWTGPQRVESNSAELGGPSVTGVSCPTARFCVAVDTAGMAFTWSGVKWSAPESADPGHSLTAVSCTGPQYCVAVDKQGYAVTRT
jgi:hypothetical protein